MADSTAATVPVEIRNRWTNEVIFTAQVDVSIGAKFRLKAAVEMAVRSKVSLDGASLDDASLDGASLNGASLNGASLNGASLDGASLDGASLNGASLNGASLNGASLNRASLNGASGDWVMSDGLKFSDYLRDVVPALLTAGGKTIDAILATGCWDCHEWTNCPMATAFDIDDLSKAPPLLRGRVAEFVQLFDARLIPKPTVPAPAEAEVVS